jgi:hypothetical protein
MVSYGWWRKWKVMNVGWMFQSDEVGCFDVSKMPGSFPINPSIGGFVLHDDTQIIPNAEM